MDQQVNTPAPDARGTAYDEARKVLGGLVVGVRVDAVPADEADRLAAEGKFYPLTLDKNGFLRVTLPESGTKVETNEPEIALRIEKWLERIWEALVE